MQLECKNCGHWRIEIFYHDKTKPDVECICRDCGTVWLEQENLFDAWYGKENLFKEVQVMSNQAASQAPPITEVFGIQVPPDSFYLHRGHTWVRLEDTGRVRVGLDDFSQKILGPVDEIKLPMVGRAYFQDHICLALLRQGHRASFEAPVDGTIEGINPKVQQHPELLHNDPYGEGWLFTIKPTNFKRNLETLYSGEATAAWLEQESHRLLSLMEAKVGVTLPSGGEIIDDVFGHYPKLGWRPLVQEFFLQNLTRDWKKRT